MRSCVRRIHSGRIERVMKRMDGQILGYLMGLTAALIWGGGMTMIRLGVVQTDLNANDLTAIRFAVSGVLMLPVLALRGPIVGPRRLAWGWGGGIILAMGAGVLYMALVSHALTYVQASHSAVAPASLPVFTALAMALLYRQMPSRRMVVGVALAAAGIFMIMRPESFSVMAQQNLGHILLMLAALSWTVYTVCSKAWHVEPLHGVAVVSVYSAFLFLPYYVWSGRVSDLLGASWSDIAVQAMVQGVLMSIVALLAYAKAVALLGVSRAALFPTLFPAVTVVSAALLIEEVPTWLETLVVALIICGLYFAFNVSILAKIYDKTRPMIA